MKSENSSELVKDATQPAPQVGDNELRTLPRAQVLKLPERMRLRWFYLNPVAHRELKRVTADILELMEENNDVSVISLIGLSGVGKTRGFEMIENSLKKRYATGLAAGELPVVAVAAPANGEKSMSWRVLYQRILHAGGALAVPSMHAARVVDGRLVASHGRATIPELREFIETMVSRRGVRALIIDEALHLLRSSQWDVVMDTLKSLSDVGELKLILIGSYDIAPLMLQYGQVARRAEIVHFKPYVVPDVKDKLVPQAPPRAPTEGESSSDAYEFYQALEKSLAMWPNEHPPELTPLWWQLMDVCLGSIGMLKMLLLRLAALQMASKSKICTLAMLSKAGKSAKAIDKMKVELQGGCLELTGACYGDSKLGTTYLQCMKSLHLPNVSSASEAKPESWTKPATEELTNA